MCCNKRFATWLENRELQEGLLKTTAYATCFTTVALAIAQACTTGDLSLFSLVSPSCFSALAINSLDATGNNDTSGNKPKQMGSVAQTMANLDNQRENTILDEGILGSIIGPIFNRIPQKFQNLIKSLDARKLAELGKQVMGFIRNPQSAQQALAQIQSQQNLPQS